MAINILIRKRRTQRLIRIQIVKGKDLIWVFARWVEEISFKQMKKKVEYAKSLVVASLVVSLSATVWGIYELTNNEILIGLGFIVGGVAMGWNDWSKLFEKKK